MGAMETVKDNDEVLKDELLRLIEEGDPTVILSSEYTESLNELIKHEFICIKNDSLRLTEKGKQAQIAGIKAVAEQNKPVEERLKLKDFPQEKNSAVISNHSFLIILFFFLISILAMLALIKT